VRNHNYLLLLVSTLILLVALVACSRSNPEAEYPTQPIEYVTTAAPGGAMDVFGRMVIEAIKREGLLNQSVSVANKSGGNGAVAMAYTMTKKGDPYTILGFNPQIIRTPLLEQLPYSYKDFTPIANLAADGKVLVVRAQSPFQTIDDLISAARQRPKELTMGGAASTSAQVISGRVIQSVAGVQWNIVNFQSDAESVTNVLGGHVDFSISNPDTTLAHVRSGTLRVLLNCADARYSAFKDAPTQQEAGLGTPVTTYRGFMGPPEMPSYASKKLEVVFKRVAESTYFKGYIEEGLLLPVWLPAVEFGEWMDKQNEEDKKLKAQGFLQ